MLYLHYTNTGGENMLLTNGKKRIPIGYEDFKQLIDSGFYYVDKSMLIYELLHSGGQNNLITRPRRFGKTLNFSMLKYFFDINEKDNAYLFDGLKISEYYEELAMYRNTHPVITLSLKCAKQGNYREALRGLKYEIQRQFINNKFILDSDKLADEYKDEYKKILSMDEDAVWSNSIQLLSICLKQYYGTKTIILIDEYDVPLEDAYFSGYYDEMVRFIRSLFESALKTNSALEFSVITGCLRISKESIFTGLNNFKVVSITDSRFDEQFGFTDEEVQRLLADYHLKDHIEETKEWYDGYHFGDTDVYCPWDVVNHVDCLLEDPNAEPQSYWINTSGNDLVKRFIDKADKTTRNEIERLIAGDMIEKSIRMELTYDEIDNSIDNLWSILFTTGYLTQQGKSERGVYRLVIPNKEIREVYILQIQEWFKDSVLHNREPINQLLKAIKEGDADTVEKDLTKILVNTISIFDTKSRKEEKEIFYHGIVLGLLRCESEWLIQSNIESGDGLVDILIETEDPDAGIIIELKYAQTFQGLSKACENAMRQIRERRYDERLRNEGRNDILAYGIAFCKKKCKVVVERL